MGLLESIGGILKTLSEIGAEINSNEEWAANQSNRELKRNYDNDRNSFAKKAAVYKEAQKRVNKKQNKK